MASKVFMDANILLDLTLKRKEYEQATKIIQFAIDSKINLFTTAAILHIIAYYTRQAYGESVSKKLLLTLLTDIHLIDCDHETAFLPSNFLQRQNNSRSSNCRSIHVITDSY